MKRYHKIDKCMMFYNEAGKDSKDCSNKATHMVYDHGKKHSEILGLYCEKHAKEMVEKK